MALPSPTLVLVPPSGRDALAILLQIFAVAVVPGNDANLDLLPPEPRHVALVRETSPEILPQIFTAWRSSEGRMRLRYLSRRTSSRGHLQGGGRRRRPSPKYSRWRSSGERTRLRTSFPPSLAVPRLPGGSTCLRRFPARPRRVPVAFVRLGDAAGAPPTMSKGRMFNLVVICGVGQNISAHPLSHCHPPSLNLLHSGGPCRPGKGPGTRRPRRIQCPRAGRGGMAFNGIFA